MVKILTEQSLKVFKQKKKQPNNISTITQQQVNNKSTKSQQKVNKKSVKSQQKVNLRISGQKAGVWSILTLRIVSSHL